jgi:hypothetical protein
VLDVVIADNNEELIAALHARNKLMVELDTAESLIEVIKDRVLRGDAAGKRRAARRRRRAEVDPEEEEVGLAWARARLDVCVPRLVPPAHAPLCMKAGLYPRATHTRAAFAWEGLGMPA